MEGAYEQVGCWLTYGGILIGGDLLAPWHINLPPPGLSELSFFSTTHKRHYSIEDLILLV